MRTGDKEWLDDEYGCTGCSGNPPTEINDDALAS